MNNKEPGLDFVAWLFQDLSRARRLVQELPKILSYSRSATKETLAKARICNNASYVKNSTKSFFTFAEECFGIRSIVRFWVEYEM